MSKENTGNEKKMSIWEIKCMVQELLMMLEDPDIDDEFVLGSIESLEGSVEEKFEGCGYIVKEYDNKIATCKEEINRLKKKIKSLEKGKKRLKDNMLSLMLLMEKKTLKSLTYTFTVKPESLSVVIDKPEAVPDEYKIPQPDKIDNAKIKEYIKLHGSTSYAHNEVGPNTLSIR